MFDGLVLLACTPTIGIGMQKSGDVTTSLVLFLAPSCSTTIQALYCRNIGTLVHKSCQAPDIFLNAVNKFAAGSDVEEPSLGLILSEALRRKPWMLPKYGRPDPGTDILFKPDYVHVKSLSTWDKCCKVLDPAEN